MSIEYFQTEAMWRAASYIAFDLMRDTPDEGRRIAGQMREQAAAQRHPVLGTFAELAFAFADFFEGNLTLAEPEFERTAAMFELLGDAEGIAFAELGTVAVWRKHGRVEQAYSRVHSKILPLLPQNDNHLSVLVLNMLGILSQELGFTDEAVRHFYAALEQAKRLGISNRISQILANLGEVFYISGNAEYAERLLLEAHALACHSNERWLAPFISTMLALCQLALDKYEDAYQAVAGYTNDEDAHHTDHSSRAFCYSVAAYTLAKRGQLTEASRLSQSAMLLINGFEDKHLKPYSWWVSGHLHRCHKRYPEAIQDLRRAIDESGDKGYVYTPLCAMRELAEVYAELGRWEEAYQEQCRYIDLFTRAQSRANKVNAETMNVKNELSQLSVARQVAEEVRVERRIWDDELQRILAERV
jgi:tetratricopeptide (TPR) repeat protein